MHKLFSFFRFFVQRWASNQSYVPLEKVFRLSVHRFRSLLCITDRRIVSLLWPFQPFGTLLFELKFWDTSEAEDRSIRSWRVWWLLGTVKTKEKATWLGQFPFPFSLLSQFNFKACINSRRKDLQNTRIYSIFFPETHYKIDTCICTY